MKHKEWRSNPYFADVTKSVEYTSRIRCYFWLVNMWDIIFVGAKWLSKSL